MNQENDMLWGGFFGFVLGVVVAKVYQTWAIIYRTEGMGFSGSSGWRNGILSTPLWVRATEHPLAFTIVVVIIFTLIGMLFIRYYIHDGTKVQMSSKENQDKLFGLRMRCYNR